MTYVCYIFWFFGPIESTQYCYDRIPLKPVLGGVSGVALSITTHEQTQSNRVCYYISWLHSVLPKDPLFRLYLSSQQQSLSACVAAVKSLPVLGFSVVILSGPLGSQSILNIVIIKYRLSRC